VLVNDYITALKSEIDTLKSHTESLERDRDEWKEEARRKDTIIAQVNQSLAALINRVPELEAPPDAPESVVSHGNGESRGDIPPEAEKGFWRRIFG
jgi:predicted  nucleic acid-binding Zn-ribbon protein